MDAIWQWGLAVVIAVQRIFGPELDGVFRAFTFLGEEEFYLLLLPLFLWCVDFRLGARLGLIVLVSAFLNSILKDLFADPRPYELRSDVKLGGAEGYGLPSGHAQSSAAVWGSVAAWARRTWVWILSAVLAGGVGLSRIYLGVHFPTDVLAGWLLGAAAVAFYWSRRHRVEGWLAARGTGVHLALALLVPIALFAAYPVKGTASELGALAGVGAGLALTYRYVPFSAGGPLWQRALRFILGGAVMFGLYMGLRIVLPGEGSPGYLLLRFMRYAIVGLWASWLAPWFFLRLRLVPTRPARGPRVVTAPAPAAVLGGPGR
ncbi:MAG: phosphatase PAP2 family protein [bacterium]